MSKRRKGRKPRKNQPRKKPQQKKPAQKDPNALPQKVFDPVVKRLDNLIRFHEKKWPDGVNPRGLLGKRVGHIARAYKAGVRVQSLLDGIQELIVLLDVPGLDLEDDDE